MGLDPVSWAAIATAAITAVGTGVSLATAPGTPKVTPPTKPPPPPPPAALPPPAPTETEVGEGVAKGRKKRAAQFGLEQTLLAGRTPLGAPGAGMLGGATSTGARATLGGG